MATNQYTSVSISGYNTNPPPDDGTTGADNQLKWSRHKDKIGDPLKNLAESINTNVLAAFGKTINIDPDQDNSVAGSIGFTSSELTISGGSVTITRSHHTIDTESDTSSDDLATIVNSGTSDGSMLLLRAANSARIVTIKDGLGNIILRSGDEILTTTHPLSLIRIGTNWYKTTPSDEVTTKAKLSALVITGFIATQTFYVKGRLTTGDGYEGRFRWVSGDQSTNVTADTQGAIWVAPDSDSTGASGAWKRMNSDDRQPLKWSGSINDGVADDTTAAQAAQTLAELTGATVIVPPGSKTKITSSISTADSKTVYWEADSYGDAKTDGADNLGNTSNESAQFIFTGAAANDSLFKCGGQTHVKFIGINFSTTNNAQLWNGIQIGDRGILSGIDQAASLLHMAVRAGLFLIEKCSFHDFGSTALIIGGETFGSVNKCDFKNNAQHVDYEGLGEEVFRDCIFEELLNLTFAPRTVTGGGPYPTPVYDYTDDASRNAGVYIGRSVAKLKDCVFVASLDKTLLKFESCNVVSLEGVTLERPGNTVMASDAIVFANDGTSLLFGKSCHISGGHFLATAATGAITGRMIKFEGTEPTFRTFSIRDTALGYGGTVDDFLPLIDFTTSRPFEISYDNCFTDHSRSPLLGFSDGENGDGTQWLAGVKGADISFHTIVQPDFTVLANATDAFVDTTGFHNLLRYIGLGSMALPVQLDVKADATVGPSTQAVDFFISRDTAKSDKVTMNNTNANTGIFALRSQYMFNTATTISNNIDLKYDSGSGASTTITYSVRFTYAFVRAFNRGGTPSIADLYVGTSAPL